MFDVHLGGNGDLINFQNSTTIQGVQVMTDEESIPFAFLANCSNVSVVNVSGLTKTISSKAFRNCTSLTTIDLTNCPVLETLGSYAFEGCTNLKSIKLPSTVKVFGEDCFKGCTSLSSVTITSPTDGITLGSGCFSGCTSIKKISFMQNCTLIGNSAFESCSSLISGSINNLIEEVSNQCFKNCVSLTSVTLPSSVITISEESFMGCENLTTIDISHVVTFKRKAFYGCTSLKDAKPNEEVATSVDDEAFRFTKVKDTLPTPKNINDYEFQGWIGVSSVTISDITQTIGNYAFESCYGIVSLSLLTVKKIGNGSFANCTALTGCTIPSTATEIGDAIFSGCTALKTAQIHKGTTKIGEKIFKDCRNLTNVTIEGEKSIGITESMFYGCTSLKTITLKCDEEGDVVVLPTSNDTFRNLPLSGKLYLSSGITTNLIGEEYVGGTFLPKGWTVEILS